MPLQEEKVLSLKLREGEMLNLQLQDEKVRYL